jgi:hypothetical protein
MRHLRIALGLASLPLLASGCFEDVMTLQPLHTERTVVDEPHLVGTWKFCDRSGLDWDVTCKVSGRTDHGYRIVVDANGQKRTYIGYVVALAKMRIIDLAEERPGKAATAADSPPAHWFARLECENNRLTIYPTSSYEFRRLAQTHPLRSHTKNERLIVTASTPELQAFFSETGAAAFQKPSKIVLRKCAEGEVIKPTFAGFDPFGTPWTLFSGWAKTGTSTGRLRMPPLTDAPYVRVKQLAEAFVRTGHDVRYVRGSTAPGPEKVHAVEAQDPLPGAPLRADAAIVLTLYAKDFSNPLPSVPDAFSNPDP